jgi:hypothetical protein
MRQWEPQVSARREHYRRCDHALLDPTAPNPIDCFELGTVMSAGRGGSGAAVSSPLEQCGSARTDNFMSVVPGYIFLG